MVDEKVNFELVPEIDWGDEYEGVSGRATTVVRMESLDGSFVEKFVSETGPYAMRWPMWLAKQIDAAQITNDLRAKHNPHYDVPKTFISHGHVREQYVDGINADEYTGNKADLIPAIAHFINDMSELRPLRFVRNHGVNGLQMENIADLDKLLDKVRKYNVVREENLKLIRDVFEFLRDIPENNYFVFGHNDLHPGNVLVNPKTGRMSVIDFELSGYQPMSYMLYTQMQMGPPVWDYVNKLPRVVNPKLRWNYDARIAELYNFMHRVMLNIEKSYVYDKDMAANILSDINMLCNPVVRKKFAALKLKYQDTLVCDEMSLVPVSHYERG